MSMCISERTELDALRGRVDELVRRLVSLEQAMVRRFDAEREIVVPAPDKTLHLKGATRGK